MPGMDSHLHACQRQLSRPCMLRYSIIQALSHVVVSAQSHDFAFPSIISRQAAEMLGAFWIQLSRQASTSPMLLSPCAYQIAGLVHAVANLSFLSSLRLLLLHYRGP